MTFGGLFPFDVKYRLEAWFKYFSKLDTSLNIKIRTQFDGKGTIKPMQRKIITSLLNFSDSADLDDRQIFDEDAMSKVLDTLNGNAKQNVDLIKKFIDDIKDNENIYKTLPYDEYNEELENSMFTIILKCYYGKFDSLNFRVITSLYNGCIPLIDEDYDVGNLQIPVEFKNDIIVSSHNDIEQKIKYFRENPEEYKKLFFKLYDYYIKDEHFSIDYYRSEFKNNLFREIYEPINI